MDCEGMTDYQAMPVLIGSTSDQKTPMIIGAKSRVSESDLFFNCLRDPDPVYDTELQRVTLSDGTVLIVIEYHYSTATDRSVVFKKKRRYARNLACSTVFLLQESK
jgi:hypothetical protein